VELPFDCAMARMVELSFMANGNAWCFGAANQSHVADGQAAVSKVRFGEGR
jgi:hypothetical protein